MLLNFYKLCNYQLLLITITSPKENGKDNVPIRLHKKFPCPFESILFRVQSVKQREMYQK